MNKSHSDRWMLIIVSALLLPSVCPAQGSGKDTIYVGRVKVQDSVTQVAGREGKGLEAKRFSEVLDTQLLAAFSRTGVFQLVERKRKEDLELEQAFSAVAVDPNDKNIAQLGKMAGATYVILATVDGFEDRSQTLQHTAIGRESTNRELFASVTLQIVDTTTGRILPDIPSVQMVKAENVELGRPGGARNSDRVLVSLVREMAAALARQATAHIKPAKVLAVTGKQLLINQGTGAGFEPGVMVEIFATETIVDEDSGDEFMNEVPVGKAQVTRADGRKSFALIEGENLGVAKGCIARPLTRTEAGAADYQGQGSWTGGTRTTSNPADKQPGEKPESPGSSDKPW